MARVHVHPCARCQGPVACDGEREQNVDGWPEVICTSYHRADGSTADCLCEDCAARSQKDEAA